MTPARSATAHKRERPAEAISVSLSLPEVETLVAVSDHYARVMGPMRHLVVLTSSRDIRRRYHFVNEESKWLRAFAETTHADMLSEGRTELKVDLTYRTAIAFWGRLLAGLDSRRARRKLSQEEIARREVLSEKLGRALAPVWRRKPTLVEQELATRRPVEAGWMRQRLEAQ